MTALIHRLGHVAAVTLAFWAGHSAHAQSSPSLGEARLGVIKGTSAGITLIGRTPASAPEVSRSGASAPTGATKAPVQRQAQNATTPEAGAPASPSVGAGWGALLRSLPPPQGDAMSAAKRLDSPSLGIALPSAASAPIKPASAAR
jgi:hypothetical protein